MIEVRAKGNVVTFRVYVQPRARRDAVVGEHGGMVKVAVTAAPEKGKANESVVEVLAEALGVAKSAIQIVSGAASREKSVRVVGVSPEAIRTAATRS